MVKRGIQASIETYACLLQGCTKMKALAEGKRVHAHIIKSGSESNIFLGNSLVNMYAKCGSIEDAYQVFSSMCGRDVVSWNVMMAGYAQQGYGEEALMLFEEMQREGVRPDNVTFVCILKACTSLTALECGKQIHAYMIKSGFEFNVFVGNTLIGMYAKCGDLEDARKVFNRMHKRDAVSWNVMIAGYAQQGHAEESMTLFEQMQRKGVKPDNVTFIGILKACTILASLERGKQVHAQIIKNGSESDVFVGSTLVDMYAKCGSIEDAHQVFSKMSNRNVVSWNAMIGGYAQQGHCDEAHTLFEQMQREGIKPNKITFVSILKSCATSANLEWGKQVHVHVIESGYGLDVFVGSALVDMYAKCGSIADARRVFNGMLQRDVVSWTAMITGYAQQGSGEEALLLFEQMQREGVKPNNVTFISILKVCTDLVALEQGRQVHGHTLESGFELDVSVGNTLVDMYAKCGSIEDARQVFNRMRERDVVSWTVMIAGYAQQGHGKEALLLFEQMQHEGVKPDNVTFVSILLACSHAGLVDEAYHHFNSISQSFGINPTMEHYACMVDLLGRAGRLDEAEEFINKMPFQPNAVVWIALLGACRSHGNVELGRHAFESTLKLELKSSGAYALLSNICAAAGWWDEVTKIRKMMEDTGVKKELCRSWIEVNNDFHTFFVADKTHPQSKEIRDELQGMTDVMEESGYVPDLSSVLHDVGDEQKEVTLCSHSEKLAIGLGLIGTPPGTPIRIRKNLRMCSGCHNGTKIISRIVGREIIARDANHFHHFKNGVCSCGDFW